MKGIIIVEFDNMKIIMKFVLNLAKTFYCKLKELL